MKTRVKTALSAVVTAVIAALLAVPALAADPDATGLVPTLHLSFDGQNLNYSGCSGTCSLTPEGTATYAVSTNGYAIDTSKFTPYGSLSNVFTANHDKSIAVLATLGSNSTGIMIHFKSGSTELILRRGTTAGSVVLTQNGSTSPLFSVQNADASDSAYHLYVVNILQDHVDLYVDAKLKGTTATTPWSVAFANWQLGGHYGGVKDGEKKNGGLIDDIRAYSSALTVTQMRKLSASLNMSTAGTGTTGLYVQNGLVACWDGIENAGVGQHNDSPSAWVDLVGGLEITKPSWVMAESNGFYSTSSTATRTYPTISSIPGLGDNVTIEVVSERVKWTSSEGNYWQLQHIISSPYGGFGYRLNVTSGVFYRLPVSTAGNLDLYYLNSNSGGFDVSKCHTYTARITLPYDASNVMVVDGAAVDGFQFESTLALPSTWTFFNAQRADIRIHAIRVYNRRLTDAEIAANQAVDELRFKNGAYATSLGVTGSPSDVGSPSPAYGVTNGLAANASFTVSCGATSVANADGSILYSCTGWKLYDGDDNLLSSGSGTSFTYEHPNPAAYRRLEWQWAASQNKPGRIACYFSGGTRDGGTYTIGPRIDTGKKYGLTGSLSMSAWVCVSTNITAVMPWGSTYYGAVIAGQGFCGNEKGFGLYAGGYEDADPSNDSIVYQVRIPNDGSGNIVRSFSYKSDTLFSAGEWHHYLLVRDKAASKMRSYVDGELLSETDCPSSWVLDASRNFAIACNLATPGGSFCGYIADVALWDVALSADDARRLHRKGLENVSTAPLAYFPLDDGLGNSVKEICGSTTNYYNATGTLEWKVVPDFMRKPGLMLFVR
jgi:hypothetical protein